METVKVDIRKLQLLTERINQTIEALNQVRLSVHGLQSFAQPYGQQYGQPFGQQNMYQGLWPQAQSQYGIPGLENRPYGMQGIDPRSFGVYQGLENRPYGMQGVDPRVYGMQGYDPRATLGVQGIDPRVYAQGFGGVSPFGIQGFGTPYHPGQHVSQIPGYGMNPFAHTGNAWGIGERLNGGRPAEQNGLDFEAGNGFRHTQVFPNAFAGAAH